MSQYFTGTVTIWALGGTWPAGFAIDGNGVVTGTGTVDEEVFPNLTISADNIYETPVVSNTFTGTTQLAVVLPVFHAATFDPTTKQLVLQLVGSGSPTPSHTSKLYCQDQDGNWQAYDTDKPVWFGGRYVDQDNVFADVTPGGALIDPQPYLQFYPAATNVLHNSNVVGTETPTVVTGKVSIVVYVDNGDVASAIVTAGTATATGYGTATPGSPIELDVTVGGTITVELTGVPFAVNVCEAQILRGQTYGPIITTTAPVATDIPVYPFADANHDNVIGAYYNEHEVQAAYDAGGIMYLFGLGTADTGGSIYTYVGATTARTRDQAGGFVNLTVPTLVAGKVYKGGTVYDVSTTALKSINQDGVWSLDDDYGNYRGDTPHAMSANVISTLQAIRIREIRRYDIADYAEGQALIDTLMLDTLQMVAGTGGGAEGYESGAFGTLTPDTTFGFTINELSEKSNDVTLIIDGIQLQDILEQIEINGWTGNLLAADSFVTGGGVSTWTWDNTTLTLINTQAYEVKVQVMQA
jgi:hypothetical protein